MNINEIKIFSSLRNSTIKGIKLYSRRASKSFFFPKLSRFINKYLYSSGLASSLNRYDNSLTFFSAFADKKLYSDFLASDKFLNFGSGAFFHNRWKNYDYPGQSSYYKSIQGREGVDFHSIDLCDKNLKIPEHNDSVSLIYCSHTLEHLDKESMLRFIYECFRILKKNGVLRVALPNTKNDFYLTRCILSQSAINEEIKRNYLRDSSSHIFSDTNQLSNNEIAELHEKSKYESDLFYTSVSEKYPEFINFDGTNPERHINYLDFEGLIKVAKNIGFTFTIPTYQGSSVASPFTNLHVFDTTEPHISFYADIIK